MNKFRCILTSLIDIRLDDNDCGGDDGGGNSLAASALLFFLLSTKVIKFT